jgi:hypothetical protein
MQEGRRSRPPGPAAERGGCAGDASRVGAMRSTSPLPSCAGFCVRGPWPRLETTRYGEIRRRA